MTEGHQQTLFGMSNRSATDRKYSWFAISQMTASTCSWGFRVGRPAKLLLHVISSRTIDTILSTVCRLILKTTLGISKIIHLGTIRKCTNGDHVPVLQPMFESRHARFDIIIELRIVGGVKSQVEFV